MNQKDKTKALLWLACFLGLVGGLGWVTIVNNLQGRNVAETAPSDGQVLSWTNSNTSWSPGTASSLIGNANGDVTGSYTNTSVVKIQGRAVENASPDNGDHMVWQNANSRWEPTAAAAAVDSLTGSDGLTANGEADVAKTGTVTVTPTWSATVAAVAGTGAAGSASEFSRGDHSHTGVASIMAGPGMIFDVSTGAVIGSVDSANITPTWANVQSPPSVYAGNGMLGDGTLAGGAITLHCDSTAITPTWANVQNQPAVYAGNGMTGDGTLAAGAITLHCDSTAITPTWANVQSKPSVNAGVGMAGGGSLATDVTLHVDSSAITPTWSNLQSPPTFTAGDYLSGGGDLSTNRTFDVEIGSISAAVTPTWSNLQSPPTLTAGDYLSGGGDLSTNRTLDVEIGALSVNVTPTWSNLQSIDAEIAALAGLTSAADKGIQFTGVGTAATYDLTAAGKALLDDATAGDQRTTLGVGTGDSPQFTALNVGHASDTTITRTGAGDVAVEGNAVYRAGGTDVPVTDGGTGASTAAAGFDALAPTTTRGDIIYRGATNNARLAIGANGYVLTSNGTDPTWAAAAAGGGGVYNWLINGGMQVWQRGTSFNNITTPLNSDSTYLQDRWVLLSDGNNVVTVTQESTTIPTGGLYACTANVTTASKKFGFLQIIERKNIVALIQNGACSLSFKARKGSGNTTVDHLRAGVLAWSSTADAPTRDVVSAWNAEASDPTLVANWTYENTPSDLTLTTAYQTFEIENITLDTASTTNLAVFIWVDNDDGTVGDTIHFTDVQLETGATANTFARRSIADELVLCKRYLQYPVAHSDVSWLWTFYAGSTNGHYYSAAHQVQMRTASATVSGTWGATNCSQPSVASGVNTYRILSTPSGTGYCELYTNSSDDYIKVEGEF